MRLAIEWRNDSRCEHRTPLRRKRLHEHNYLTFSLKKAFASVVGLVS
jgi:hypothetical protein